MYQILRGRGGEPVARITTDGVGDAKLYTIGGKYLGWYKKKQDKTYDDRGRMIGQGNLLAMLVPSNTHALGYR